MKKRLCTVVKHFVLLVKCAKESAAKSDVLVPQNEVASGSQVLSLYTASFPNMYSSPSLVAMLLLPLLQAVHTATLDSSLIIFLGL